MLQPACKLMHSRKVKVTPDPQAWRQKGHLKSYPLGLGPLGQDGGAKVIVMPTDCASVPSPDPIKIGHYACSGSSPEIYALFCIGIQNWHTSAMYSSFECNSHSGHQWF